MRSIRLLCLAASLSACAKAPGGPPPAPMEVPPYAPLLARARAQDTTLNFRELRLAYTGSADYAPYGTRDSDLRKAMYTAADAEAFGPARVWADSLLSFNFVDIEAHGLASYASAELGDSTRSAYHRWVTNGLLGSIDKSGDGSKAHPLEIISVAEEYAWASYSGFRRKGLQGLGDCNHRPCDWIEFTSRRTQQDTTIYFDISIPYGTLERSLKH